MDMLLVVSLPLGIAAYFAPTIVAQSRGVQSLASIFSLNLCLGWTLVGWMVALKWAQDAESLEEALLRTKMESAMLVQRT